MIGQNITHYRITEKLGEGGMGVVYKAEDTKLSRTVALKFLGAHLLGDAQAKQRFLREAQAAAALNHPNICTVYEIDEADGKTFIAMAFVEGESLEDRIARGPLPIQDALDIAQQIAKGLQAAHNKGIIHRDIKPANLLIATDGPVTIMDFGLARLTEASRLTKADTTMGTVAYMSPEQAQGQEVDHRSDIWSFGCALYEMIRGQRPFQGQYDQALFYEIVNQEPEPLTGVRAGVPMELEFIVGKCLAKDADSRYQTTSELAVDLKNLQEKLKSGRSAILKTSGMPPAAPAGSEPAPGAWAQHATPPPSAAMAARPVWKWSLPWPVAAILAVALAAVAFLHFPEGPPSELPLRKFAYTPPAEITGGNVVPGSDGWISNLAISPNGKHIAFVTGERANRQLWTQDLDQRQPRLIAQGDGLAGPFWSPGSDSIGFATEGNARELKRVSVQGGSSSLICELPGLFLPSPCPFSTSAITTF